MGAVSQETSGRGIIQPFNKKADTAGCGGAVGG